MSDTVDPRYADKRTVERYVRSGLVDEKVWEKHLKSLPDVSEKASPVQSAMDPVDDLDESNDDDVAEE